MKRHFAILGALLMIGVSFAGCLGGDEGDDGDDPLFGDGGGGETPDVEDVEGPTAQTYANDDIGPFTEFGTHAFMQDPAVRAALSYAFPYETVHESVYHGYMSPLPGPIPRGMPFYDTQAFVYEENLERAVEILDAAGYEADGGARFGGEPIRIFYNSGNTQREQNAQLYKQSLAQIGINAEVQGLAWPQFLERMFETTNWDIMFLGWAPDYNDPDDYWFPFAASETIEGFPDLHGDTFNTNYNNSRLNELLLEAKYTLNDDDRRAAYEEAFELYMNEPALIFIGQNANVDVYRDWVEGFEQNPMVTEPGYFYNLHETEASESPDTFVYATFGDPKNLNPADAYDTASGLPIQNIYDTLVRYEGGETEEVQPRLATDWEVDESGLNWTFNLREGVTFANGNPFTAEDVVFSFQNVLLYGAPESGVSWILEQSLDVDGIEAVDDHTVRMSLKYPYGGFLPTIAYTVGSIIDKEYCEEHGGLPVVDDAGEVTDPGCNEFLKENPMGTNAYKLERWDKNNEVVLVQNENYWEGWEGDHLNRVVIRNIEEPNTRILALLEGEADFAVIDLDKLDQVEGQDGVVVETGDAFTVTLGVLQTQPTVEG